VANNSGADGQQSDVIVVNRTIRAAVEVKLEPPFSFRDKLSPNLTPGSRLAGRVLLKAGQNLPPPGVIKGRSSFSRTGIYRPTFPVLSPCRSHQSEIRTEGRKGVAINSPAGYYKPGKVNR